MPRGGIQRTQTIDQQTGDFAVSVLRANLGPQHTASRIPKETGSDHSSHIVVLPGSEEFHHAFHSWQNAKLEGFVSWWCGRGDLNPHGLATART